MTNARIRIWVHMDPHYIMARSLDPIRKEDADPDPGGKNTQKFLLFIKKKPCQMTCYSNTPSKSNYFCFVIILLTFFKTFLVVSDPH